ncbi:hypothetical protein AX15_003992 [Amanita polypyramis BW_CC]|nr:hypothetical protein AX15_003992 [Amanita polypyramis BW_CC]
MVLISKPVALCNLTMLNTDPVKDRLNSLEASLTILKLLNAVYPPASWIQAPSDDDETCNIWTLRMMISNWGWRTITELKNVKDESLQIFGQDILPSLAPALQTFCPPFALEEAVPFRQRDHMLAHLVNADFEFLEECCTLIESLSLDVEDVRLCLARGFNFSSEHQGVPCLSIMLDFIEHGAYPPYWKYLPESDSKKKQKAFDICKAALIKSVVEVSGEERNEDVLWSDTEGDMPGGLFVSRMVNWIKSYTDPQIPVDQTNRDDLVMCGTLSLGNLTRRETTSIALLSPPHSLASVLVSRRLLGPSSDIKMKHGVIGLLKHIAQSGPGSSPITSILDQVNTLQRIVESRIWDESPDPMISIVQLSAIGIAKHLCGSSLDHALAMFQRASDGMVTGMSQILNLIQGTDNVAVRSEGTRVIVNTIKTLWMGDSRGTSPEITSPTAMSGNSEEILEKQQRRQAAIRAIVIADVVSALSNLIAHSRRHPVLVNEAIIALSLLSATKDGGPLVIGAIRETSDVEPPTPTDTFPTSLASSETSSPVTTPSSIGGRGLASSYSGLDILVFVLKNVDNPVNFPVEIRVNVCAFLVQLGRNTTAEELSKVKEVVKPALEKLATGEPHTLAAPGKEELLRRSVKKVLDAWAI